MLIGKSIVAKLTEVPFEGDVLAEYVPFGLIVWARQQGLVAPRWEEAVGAEPSIRKKELRFNGIRLEYVLTEGECHFYAGTADDRKKAGKKAPLEVVCYWAEKPIRRDGPLCHWDTVTLLMVLFSRPLS